MFDAVSCILRTMKLCDSVQNLPRIWDDSESILTAPSSQKFADLTFYDSDKDSSSGGTLRKVKTGRRVSDTVLGKMPNQGKFFINLSLEVKQLDTDLSIHPWAQPEPLQWKSSLSGDTSVI